MKYFSSRVVFASAFLLTTVAFQFSSCKSDSDEPNGPNITSIFPTSGQAKTRVVITGSELIADGVATIVKFNGVPAEIRSSSENEIAVFAPDADSGPVTVTVGTIVLTGPDYTYAEPIPEAEYFIKFKANGRWKIYQVAEPGYSACYQCSCSNILPELVSADNSSEIQVCYNDGSMQATKEMIEALENTTVTFGSIFPQARLHYNVDGVDFSSEEATQTSGSKMMITAIEPDGDYMGYAAYKVTGTFACTVKEVEGSGTVAITDGSFVIRFTEDFW
jgi:hypothetical protein